MIPKQNAKMSPETRAQMNDKFWRLEHLYKLKNKDAEMKLFILNKAQKHYFKHRHKRNIILKSRQLGFTTFASLDMFDDVLSNKNFDSLLVAQTVDDATEIFRNKIVVAWDNFHDGLKKLLGYEVNRDRANQLVIGIPSHKGPMQYSSIIVKNSGRSGMLRKVHISEFGKICKEDPAKADEIITGTFPAVPIDGEITIESTAEGDFGIFYDMFWDAWNRPADQPLQPTDFKAHFYNWRWETREIAKVKQIIPEEHMDHAKHFMDYQKLHDLTDRERTYYYIKWTGLNKDFRKLLQEYPTAPEEAFVASGNKLFDLDAVSRQSQHLKDPIRQEGKWNIYEEPKANHRYVLAGDPSEGQGGDHAACVIMDYTKPTAKVVATFMDEFTTPDIFAFHMKNLGQRYNQAFLIPERNNHGTAVIQKLKEIYPEDKIYKTHKQDTYWNETTEKLGWLANGSTKPHIAGEFSTALNEGTVLLVSKDLHNEAKTYPREKMDQIKRKKGESKHWDLLTAAMIALEGVRTAVMLFGGYNSTQIASPNETGYNIQNSSQKEEPFDPYAAI